MTTKSEISMWFDAGVKQGATHMLVLCDTFDYEDYPVYVKSVEAARERAAKPGDMQSVMEVYNLSMDKEAQLAERRAHNY